MRSIKALEALAAQAWLVASLAAVAGTRANPLIVVDPATRGRGGDGGGDGSGRGGVDKGGAPGADAAAWPAQCPRLPPWVLPPGYRNHSGLGLYKVHWEIREWFGAKRACEREGADLVVINSQREATMIQTLMNTYKGIDYFHVGFMDMNADGTYITVLGDPLSSSGYNVWAQGEPNNVGEENCGAIDKSQGLNDVLCTLQLGFVCELSH